jgi:hypothetical protein
MTDNENEMLKPGILSLSDLHQQFRAEVLTFPKWQRHDKWKQSFKEKLIQSILKGRMIPMLYFAVLEDEIYLLDGGHRTRAICGFKDNEFGITGKRCGVDVQIYYDKPGYNKLTERERLRYDTYPIPVYMYENITNDESREIFNELQNFRSMTVAEVCNSHASYLIDYMRDLKDHPIVLGSGTKTIYEILESKKISYPNPKCHAYLLVCLQLFSFFDGGSCKDSLNDCKGGKDTVDYLKKFSQDELASDYIAEFQQSLQVFFAFIVDIDVTKTTSLNSVYHYMVWHTIGDVPEFLGRIQGLLKHVAEYEDIVKRTRDLRNKGKDADARILIATLKSFPPMIGEWYESTVMRGTSYNSGRFLRLAMLQRHLPYPEKKDPLDVAPEPKESYVGPGILS